MKKYKQLVLLKNELNQVVRDSANQYATLLFLILCTAASFAKDRYEVWDILMRISPIYKKKNKNWRTEEIEIMNNIKFFSENYIEQKYLAKIDNSLVVLKKFLYSKEKEIEIRKTVAEFLLSIIESFDSIKIKDAIWYMIYATNPEKYMEP